MDLAVLLLLRIEIFSFRGQSISLLSLLGVIKRLKSIILPESSFLLPDFSVLSKINANQLNFLSLT